MKSEASLVTPSLGLWREGRGSRTVGRPGSVDRGVADWTGLGRCKRG